MSLGAACKLPKPQSAIKSPPNAERPKENHREELWKLGVESNSPVSGCMLARLVGRGLRRCPSTHVCAVFPARAGRQKLPRGPWGGGEAGTHKTWSTPVMESDSALEREGVLVMRREKGREMLCRVR